MKSKDKNSTLVQIFTSVKLLETLLDLSDMANQYNIIWEIFEAPLKQIPDVLLISIIKSKPNQGGDLLNDLYLNLIPMYFLGSPNMQMISELWKSNQDIVIKSLCALSKSKINFHLIIDIIANLPDSLNQFLNFYDFEFVLTVAIFAYNKDMLNFEHWLKEKLKPSSKQSKYISIILEHL